ncbi:neutral/alkaline non-lysosomal ceramidase N-terminal domain-containing protein [Daejeonella sp.]|uniref:neutral/alkaline non-lysosomal ceramidase N-terminal domain-containing protein n=1 Tax=Daejeonella sp. TaxID=2805397 RepID=UPI0027BA87F6|nr:neutral/alkaline non-lysosomal ceramidase N-terminal domain-containing protein [Daejeonella sp.]
MTNNRLNFILLILLLSSVQLTYAQQNTGINTIQSKGFRASIVKMDITPDKPKMLLGYSARQSTGINDRIYHRIVAMDDGVKQFFLVSTDICVMSPSEYDHVAAILQKDLGIDPENFWWTLTHTHSAPEVGVPGLPEVFMGDRYKHDVDTAYTSLVERSLIKGITEARNKLAKAKLGVGWGFSQANINRRAIDVDGKASLGLNPEGAVDRKIGLIRLDKEDGSPLALIANYAIHGTVLGPAQTEISGDAPGIVSEYVEQKLGVPLLFINGAAGNLAPIYSVYPNPKAGHLSQFKVLLGDKILSANKEIVSSRSDIKLFTGSLIIETPRKPNLSWPKDLSRYTQTLANGDHMVLLPARFLKINEDVAIWSLPVELFCEISNEIRDRSPFPFTFFYGYTNGWLGYLPTEKEWKHGGYEIETVSPYTPVVEKHLKEAVLGYLEGEMKSTPSFQPQSANRPTIVKTETDGMLRLTARNGKGIGPKIKYMPEWWAFGWFTNLDKVEWDAEVELEGEYNAELVWSVSDDSAGNEFLLEAGKQKLTGTIDRSGSWEIFKSKNIGTIRLKPGKQKIVFKSNKPNVDAGMLDLREIKLSLVKSK